MSGIVLSGSIRSNLLALQSTSDLQATVQNRLATGKRVNSALDGANNYFTALSLNSRAGDLSRLLDGIGNGVQTIKAANNGLDSIRKLVENAQATARQALQAAKGTVNYTNTFTGTATVAADAAATTGAGSVSLADATVAGAVDTSGDATLLNALPSALTNGETFTFTQGSQSFSIEFDTAGNGGDLDVTTATVGQLRAMISTKSGGSVTATLDGSDQIVLNGGLLGVSTAANATNVKLFGGTGAVSAAAVVTQDQTFSVQVGTGAVQTITFGTVTGQVKNMSELNTQLDALDGITKGFSIGGTSGLLTLTADDATQDITLSGTARAEILGTVAPESATSNIFRPTNSAIALINGQKLTVGLSDGTTREMTFGTATGQIANRTDLTKAIKEINAGFNNSSTAFVSNKLQISSTSQYDVTISGDAGALSTFGLSAGTKTTTATVTVTSGTRSSLQKDFNDLLKQVDQLTKDAGYNGVNLLNGDSLKVSFNERDTSSLTIQGVTYDSEGLGLDPIVSGDGFQVDANIQATLTKLDTAVATIRTQASKLGSNLSVIQNRQEFTKGMIGALQTGADNLTLADTNEEGANLLALNTRQQLSQTALSLAAQASQAVLRLF